MVEAPPEIAAPAFKLPPRNLFDVVATNDLAALLIVVRGDNPFDVSPGMQRIRSVRQMRRLAGGGPDKGLDVEVAAPPNIDAAQIPRLRDAAGNGAAHVAASLGLSAMLGVLATECGCAIDEANAAGLSPIHLAARHGHVECVRLLRDLGAQPLDPTQPGSPATSGQRSGLAGRSTLFLAHSARQLAVVRYLVPLYRELVDAACGEAELPQVWATAATEQNVRLLAVLLDALECDGTAAEALPIAFDFDVAAALRAALPALLEATLPLDRLMSAAQCFLFGRLVDLGYIVAESVVGSSRTVIDHVIDAAQPAAWRILVERGLVRPQQCSAALVQGGNAKTGGEAELRLLLEEAAAYAAYQLAKKQFTEKGDDERRRANLLRRRTDWKLAERRLQQSSLVPVRAPSKA